MLDWVGEMDDSADIFSKDQRVYSDILGAVGETPLVRLNQVTRGLRCRVFAKLEFFNPGGSVKDRIALRMIEGYEKSGQLKQGGTVVEATSGNTGIGLAIVCALKGYEAVLVMPDKMSQEKIQLLRGFGARVIITPTAVEPDDPKSYYSVAKRIVRETPNSVLANQYHNPENPASHYHTTGPEILRQTNRQVTDIVLGMGTGGTITGVAQYMRDLEHPVRIIGVDPEGSILYDAWKRGGSLDGLEAETYKVEGIGEDFIPSTLDLDLVDEIVQVTDGESFRWTRRLVREEGIFCGGSSGSAMAGAFKACKDLDQDRLVVVILPDSGSRYLSKVFDDDWMRENGFLEPDRRKVSAQEVSRVRGLPKLITAQEGDRIMDVIERMRSNAVSQLPVVDDEERLVGIVTESVLLNHLLAAEHDHAPGETIKGLVDEEVSTAVAEEPLEKVLPVLMAKKVVMLIDDLGRPSGILTIIDALEYLATAELQ